MRKLIESTHVSLGGDIDSPGEWAMSYLGEQHQRYATELLADADALLLGRHTYAGLARAYTAMPSNPFVDTMNRIPKYVASTTLREAGWNATIIDGDVAEFIGELKRRPGGNIVKYGTGRLDDTLLRHRLIDELHLLLTPVAVARGHRLFADIDYVPALTLLDVRRHDNGVVVLVYRPE
ncbi:dihydrofolate reductase family protein [Nocardia spumae]|uniref:dihydrofolate reductase family protein n=1 Tax=Nocardia spumae TaxID=2887190 RepID=UPI001D136718|nr:dihydrofolate reductase family protein [Nocardia spumae]